jgi:ubiquinol-cytochrome c reductase cytochrome b subunit
MSANVINRVIDGAQGWMNDRAPGLFKWWDRHAAKYYAPKNFNFWYFFGSLALVVFVNQILTGIWLTMNFKPSAAEAFDSVEYIMRDVEWGWLIRYMHSTGASMFFIVVYLHMFRGLIYGSYQKPRELVWTLGVVIFLVLMAEAFFGYVLPWGQMSYWGAQVITSLFGAVPFVGEALVEFIRGDYLISDATLNRFFALHVIALPFVLAGLIYLHLMALHEVGSNNPDGVDIKKVKDKDTGIPKDGIAFHPYYTIKDLFGTSFFLMIFAFIIFFEPTVGGWFLEHDNFSAANPMVTPQHIKPVWYFTPYYAMLRAIPDKLLGVVVMGAATLIFFLVPWLDRSKVKSIRYRGPITKIMITLFVISFVVLGWLGAQSGSDTQKLVAQILTFFYFAFFFTMPFWTAIDKTKPVPERVTFDH